MMMNPVNEIDMEKGLADKLVLTVVYKGTVFGVKRKVVTEHSPYADPEELLKYVRDNVPDLESASTHLWHNPHSACPARSFCTNDLASHVS